MLLNKTRAVTKCDFNPLPDDKILDWSKLKHLQTTI